MPFRRLPGCLRAAAAVVAAALPLLLVACADDPVTTHGGNNDTPPVELLPPAAPDGPIGPLTTQDLGFTPNNALPGFPTFVHGGVLIVADPTERTIHGHETHNFAHDVLATADRWRPRATRYQLPIRPTIYPFQVGPESAAVLDTGSDDRSFVVVFESGQGWYGLHDKTPANTFFELPEGLAAGDLTAAAVPAVSALRFFLGSPDGVWMGDPTRAEGDAKVGWVKIADVPVKLLATAADGQSLVAVGPDGGMVTFSPGESGDGAMWEAGEPEPGLPEPLDEAEMRADLMADGSPRLVLRGSGSTWVIDPFETTSGFDAHSDVLPGGLIAHLAGGRVTITTRDDVETALATLDGWPEQVDWFGADPAGNVLAAISGSQVTVALLDLSHPAYSTGD